MNQEIVHVANPAGTGCFDCGASLVGPEQTKCYRSGADVIRWEGDPNATWETLWAGPLRPRCTQYPARSVAA